MSVTNDQLEDVVDHLRRTWRTTVPWTRLHRTQCRILTDGIEDLEMEIRQCKRDAHQMRQHLRASAAFFRKLRAATKDEATQKSIDQFLKLRWMQSFKEIVDL